MKYTIVWYTHRNELRYSITRWPVAVYRMIESMRGTIVNITEEVNP